MNYKGYTLDVDKSNGQNNYDYILNWKGVTKQLCYFVGFNSKSF